MDGDENSVCVYGGMDESGMSMDESGMSMDESGMSMDEAGLLSISKSTPTSNSFSA